MSGHGDGGPYALFSWCFTYARDYGRASVVAPLLFVKIVCSFATVGSLEFSGGRGETRVFSSALLRGCPLLSMDPRLYATLNLSGIRR